MKNGCGGSERQAQARDKPTGPGGSNHCKATYFKRSAEKVLLPLQRTGAVQVRDIYELLLDDEGAVCEILATRIKSAGTNKNGSKESKKS
ncbi:hypothetical protein WG66_006839 [Moniliophthora roreri]|nr:hypothetical protein WG66_006839 [Moniliophthora roreri]